MRQNESAASPSRSPMPGWAHIISKPLGPQKPFQSRSKGALRDQSETSVVEVCAIKTPLIKTVWLNCTPWRERRRPWIMFHNRQTPRSGIFSQGTLKTRESVSMPSPLATWKNRNALQAAFFHVSRGFPVNAHDLLSTASLSANPYAQISEAFEHVRTKKNKKKWTGDALSSQSRWWWRLSFCSHNTVTGCLR